MCPHDLGQTSLYSWVSRMQERLSDVLAVSDFDIHNTKLSGSISNNSEPACHLPARIAAGSWPIATVGRFSEIDDMPFLSKHGRQGSTKGIQETSQTILRSHSGWRFLLAEMLLVRLQASCQAWAVFTLLLTLNLSPQICLGLYSDLLRPDVLERLKELCPRSCRWSCLSFSTLLFPTTATKTFLPVVQKGTCRCSSSCPC